MTPMNISNLTLDEIERQLYISGSPNHALFIKLQEAIEDADLGANQLKETYDDAYDLGYNEGYRAAQVEYEE
jgi:hypothetical protein